MLRLLTFSFALVLGFAPGAFSGSLLGADAEEPSTTSSNGTRIELQAGKIQGALVDDTRVFRGLPFAAPPVGDLRWRPPQPVTPWEGVRAAQEFGPMCPQPNAGRMSADAKADEDCLYLNVYAPLETSPTETGWPVLVWLHGGAFAVGTASSETYNGSALARQGAVVVTVNYRLGIFGFLAHPALSAEGGGTSGNYGLLDQVAALEWVRANAAAFGGDPGNVTIFGESAGAASVNNLMVMQAAKGLFQRAILESGHAMSAHRHLKKDKQLISGEAQGLLLTKALGLDQAEDPLAALRAVSAQALLKETGLIVGGTPSPETDAKKFWPLVDGFHIPDEPMALIAAGRVHPVDVLLGTNANEGSVLMRSVPLMTKALYRQMLEAAFGKGADQVEAMFPVQGFGQAKDVAEHVAGLVGFVAPARRLARQLSEQGQSVYLYHFTRVPKALERLGKQADHGAEIPYVFGGLDRIFQGRLYQARDHELSAEIMSMWVRFARQGEPSETWPAYTADGDAYLEFGDTTRASTGLYRAACDLFDSLL